jgi:hypothetical protein
MVRLVLMLLVLLVPLAHAADYLSAAEVEKITGISGVKALGNGSSRAAVFDQNFAGPDGKFLLGINVNDATVYERAKKEFGDGVTKLSGIGDEAFAPAPWAIYVRKGSKYIGIGSTSTGAIGEAKLQEIAKAVAARQ